MIKVRFVNMHMNRSSDINDAKSREEDQAWMEGFNNNYTLTHDYTWKNIQFVMDDYDYLAVIDCCYRHFDQYGNKIPYFDESKAVIFQAEPYALRSRYPKTLYNSDDYDKRFLKFYSQNILWGWTGLGMEQFLKNDFTKTKDISTVISTNSGLSGHSKRLMFLRDYLSKIDIDHYGDERNIKGAFTNDPLYSKNYKGYIQEKKIALTEYKYSFNAENIREKDYISEKFTDILLCEALPIYCGCLNIKKYFSEECFIEIDLDYPDNALMTIKRAIRHNEWSKRIDSIKREKQKILFELNPLNCIWTALNGKLNYWEK